MSYQADDMQEIYRKLDSKIDNDIKICGYDYNEYHISDMVEDWNFEPSYFIAVNNIDAWVEREYPIEEQQRMKRELKHG